MWYVVYNTTDLIETLEGVSAVKSIHHGRAQVLAFRLHFTFALKAHNIFLKHYVHRGENIEQSGYDTGH